MMNTALVIPVRWFGRLEGFLHSWGCCRFFLLCLLLCTPTVVLSQQRWERTYGGTGYDVAHAVQQTQDGGYIVAGTSNCYGNSYQVYLVKTDSSGDTLWTRTYGGTSHDYGYSVQQTRDGGYIVSGHTNSFGNDWQVYLIKTNSQGDTLWTRNYGGASYDYGYFVQQTQDGGYIVAGQTNSFGDSTQVYLLRTNASGDTLWSRTYGGTGTDGSYTVQQTSDGGYVAEGWTSSFGNYYQVYLIKISSSGDTLWTKTYGGASREEGRSVQQTRDGGYIVAGWAMSFGNDVQVYLVRTSSSGDTLWTKTFGGAGGDYGEAVQQTSDQGYLVAGYTDSFGDSTQVYLLRIDAMGDTLWTRTYGRTGDDRGYFFQQTRDTGCIVTGRTYSFGNYCQIYLIKTDANGSSGVEETAEVRGQRLEGRITTKPNPFTAITTVPGHEVERFSLYDVSGRKVGVYKGDRIGVGLAPGVYFLKPEDLAAKPIRIVKLR